MIGLVLMIAAATAIALLFAAPLIKAKARAAALAVGLIAPAGAFGLYLLVGSPQHVVGMDGPDASQERQLEETIAQLEQLVQEQPSNLQAWDSLASVRFSIQDYAGAITALEAMAALEPDAADIRASLGEARVLARGGVVDETARADFQAALELDPAEPRAIFYLAEAEYQAGRTGEAIDRWIRLAETSPPNAPWLAALGARLQRVAQAEQASLDGLGLDIATIEKLEAAMGGRAPVPGGPDAAAMAAMANLPPEEQAARIESMVGGLAARLEAEPDDIEGWRMLAQSYAALGRSEQQAEALGQVARLAPENAEARRAYAYHLLNLNSESGGAMEPRTIAALEALLAVDPNDPLALLALGVQARTQGNEARARDLLERLAASETAPASIRDQARSLLEG